MGMLDDLLKQQGGSGGGGGLVDLITKNPQIVAAVASLLSSRDGTVGGSGGLAAIIKAFQQKGMGDIMSSWISKGSNSAISPDQLTNALGNDTVRQFASKAGVPDAEAGNILASLLPSVINQVTPDGRAPESNSLESSLGGLIGGFLK
jgi:uncharacterized protein YidB (DUF937 family)